MPNGFFSVSVPRVWYARVGTGLAQLQNMINCRVNETVNKLFRLGNLTNIKTTSQNIQDKKLKFINHRQTKQCGTELSILIPLHGFANISSSKGSNLIQQILPEELWVQWKGSNSTLAFHVEVSRVFLQRFFEKFTFLII